MSTSKKPGTDLAALKARLAKKTKGKDEPEPVAAPPPAAAAAAPVDPLPPPGHAAPPPEPAYPQHQHLPPPGAVAPPAPMHDVAPPAHVQPPAPTPMPMGDPMGGMGRAAPAVAPPVGDDPFGGGAGSFDPADGIIDTGGELPQKSSIGLSIFVGLLGAAFGIVAGFLGHKMTENAERRDSAQKKGEAMVNGVNGIISARTDVSLAMEGLEKKMDEDPAAAAAEIEALLADKWEGQVKAEELFGWQLAAINPNGVKRSFELFDEATRVKKDLQYLQAFLASQPEALLKGNGPSQFGVMFDKGKGKLVAALTPYCGAGGGGGGGEGEAEGAEGGGGAAAAGGTPTPCPEGQHAKAVAYQVIDAIGAEPKIVPRGTGDGQVVLISTDGGVYAYAVGLEPNRNAVIYRNGLVQRVKDHLEEMVKVEKFSLKALKQYAENPNVDGSVEQPDPEAGG